VWWCKLVIPALRRLSWENGEFQSSLGNIVRAFLKKTKATKNEKKKVTQFLDWGGSVVEHLPSMLEALNSIPSTTKEKN
jgi:hypothetical protein